MSNSPPGKLSNPVGRPHNRKAINDDGKKKNPTVNSSLDSFFFVVCFLMEPIGGWTI